MNNKRNKTQLASAALALLAVLSFNAATQEQNSVQSLRGLNAVDSQSLKANVNRWQRDRDPLSRRRAVRPARVPLPGRSTARRIP